MKKNKNWQVYIIQTKTGKLYTGITTDINRRWDEHKNNKKGAKYFRLESPQKLVFIEGCKNRSEATKREYEIKRFNRNKKLKLIKDKTHVFIFCKMQEEILILLFLILAN